MKNYMEEFEAALDKIQKASLMKHMKQMIILES